MRQLRALVIGSIVTFVTFGWPTHGITEGVPPTLDATIPVVGTVAPGGHVDAVVPLPWRANTAGVSLASPDPEAGGVTVQILSLRAGEWGQWSTLRIEAEDAPDGAEAAAATRRVTTDPAWIGLADAIRVRVDLEPGAQRIGAVRLHVFNTSGNAREANIAVRAARAIKRVLTAPALQPPPAEAHPPRPSIISRRGWGANESWRSSGPGVADTLKMAFVHHTVNSNGYSRSEADDLVRGIYRYHTKTRGYSDIAYNFLVDRYGRIYEGRAGGVTEPVIGAHVKGFNTMTTGVAMIGTFTSARPPRVMWRGLKRLLAWKLDLHHINPTGRVTMISGGNNLYDKGESVRLRRISGHRHGSRTACPGYRVARRLPWLREAVEEYGDPKIYSPKLSTSTVRRDGDSVDEVTTVTASFSETVDWKLTFTDSGGVTRRTRTGTGASFSREWTGRTADGVRVPTGRYVWRIEAKRTSSGHSARAASGVVYVINNHPGGTLLSDATGKFAIDAGKRRTGDSIEVRSNFGSLRVIPTGPWERGRYGSGADLGLREGTLLQGPDAGRYIWSTATLRPFVADEAGGTFAALGYDPAAVIAVTQSYIDALPAGPPVEDVGFHPDGTLVRDPIDHTETWVIETGTRRSISGLGMRSRYRSVDVVDATAGDLTLPEGLAIPARPGAVVRPADTGRPWLIGTDGRKHRFIRWRLYYRLGYSTSMLLPATSSELSAIPTGTTYG